MDVEEEGATLAYLIIGDLDFPFPADNAGCGGNAWQCWQPSET